MAVRAAVIDYGKSATKGDGSIQRIQWNGLTGGVDTGAPIPFAEWADGCIQMGTLNILTGGSSTLTGDTAVMQGSNDYQPSATDDASPANAGTWTTLKDENGAAISATALGAIFNFNERPLWVRPAMTAGTGTWNFVLVVRRAQSMMRGG